MTVPTTETPGVPSDLTALSGTYTIDASHSRIGFVTRHAMVTKVRGSFNDFEGTATLDGADPSKSSARVVIQAASIDTRNGQRDGHLKSNDFFDMETYPTIEFVSTSARQVDGSTFELTGDLTIKGTTNPVTIPFTSTASRRTRSATPVSASKAPSSSTARTGASPGTHRWSPAASSSARRSPSSSRSARSRTPDQARSGRGAGIGNRCPSRGSGSSRARPGPRPRRAVGGLRGVGRSPPPGTSSVRIPPDQDRPRHTRPAPTERRRVASSRRAALREQKREERDLLAAVPARTPLGEQEQEHAARGDHERGEEGMRKPRQPLGSGRSSASR